MVRTPKGRALGAALRQAREEKGLLLRELAAALDRDIGVVSRWETGDRTPKPAQVARILTELAVGGERHDAIMNLAYGSAESQWVSTALPDRRSQLAAYVDWEQGATRIVEVAPLLVPGLLQTREYAHAVMTAAGVPPGEIAMRVTARLGRADAVTRPGAAQLTVYLGEAALDQRIGCPATTTGHLLAMAARPNVSLRVVPAGRGWHPGLEGAFSLMESPRPASARRDAAESASVVFVGTRRSVLMLDEESDIAAYRAAVARVALVALPDEDSAAFLRARLERR